MLDGRHRRCTVAQTSREDGYADRAFRRDELFGYGSRAIYRLACAGVRPAAEPRADFGHPRILSLRFHGAMRRRSTGRQGRARVSQAQCRTSVAVLQGGARCCWPAADRERGAGTGRAGASPGCGGGASSFRTGCAASGRCGAAGRSPAGSCRGRNQKTAITASRCGPRRLPLRLRRALPGRKAGRLCGAALPASQRRGAVSAMPRRRDGHG